MSFKVLSETPMAASNSQVATAQRRIAPKLVAEAEAILAEIKALTSDEETVRDTFEGEVDVDNLVDYLLRLTGSDEAMIVALDSEATQLDKRKARLKGRVSAGRALLHRVLTMAAIRGCERPLGTVSLSKKAPAIGELDERIVPAKFWVQPDPELDRKAILEALKAKEKIPGAKLAPDTDVLKIRRG